MRTYEPMCGERISATCQTLVQMVEDGGGPVTAKFNDVEIVARPGMTAGDLEQVWHTETDRRRKEYQDSPKGQAWLRDNYSELHALAEFAKPRLPRRRARAHAEDQAEARAQESHLPAVTAAMGEEK